MKRVKTGGRQKGTPNKRSEDIEDLLAAHNFSPVQKLMNEYPQLDPEQRTNVCLKLMKFLYPEKRAIEQSFSPEALEALETFEKFKDKTEEEILAEMKLKRID